MSDIKKENTAPEIDRSVGTAEDVEKMMKKYDRESNTRIWTGVPRLIVRYIGVIFSVYCILVTLFGTMMPEEKLNIFLGMTLIFGYLHYPITKSHVRPNFIPWYDIVIMILGAVILRPESSHALGDIRIYHEKVAYIVVCA